MFRRADPPARGFGDAAARRGRARCGTTISRTEFILRLFLTSCASFEGDRNSLLSSLLIAKVIPGHACAKASLSKRTTPTRSCGWQAAAGQGPASERRPTICLPFQSGTWSRFCLAHLRSSRYYRLQYPCTTPDSFEYEYQCSYPLLILILRDKMN